MVRAGTRAVSSRLIFDAEHSRWSAACSQVSPAASRSRRNSLPSRRRRTVGLERTDMPSLWVYAQWLATTMTPVSHMVCDPAPCTLHEVGAPCHAPDEANGDSP